MRIISWNVNSVKSRLEHLTRLLAETKPDVALLQELKCLDEAFPLMEIEDLGYNVVTHGQKSYNGVAILSKHPIEDVFRGFDEQSRYIEAFTGGVRVASVYVPNGQDEGSDKFQYKLKFFDTLKERLRQINLNDEKIIIGGDYNIAPADIDVYNPAALQNAICFHPLEKQKFNALVNSGYVDSFRMRYPDKKFFSWWDYRAGAWQKNEGLRIDHVLLNAEAADVLTDAGVDTTTRNWDKPSDHAPVWVEVNI